MALVTLVVNWTLLRGRNRRCDWYRPSPPFKTAPSTWDRLVIMVPIVLAMGSLTGHERCRCRAGESSLRGWLRSSVLSRSIVSCIRGETPLGPTPSVGPPTVLNAAVNATHRWVWI